MFHQRRRSWAGIASVAIWLSAWAAAAEPAAEPEGGVAAKESEIAAANNAFAFELYRELVKGRDNLFISPYSIHSALAMTQEGARGNTRAQMRAALHSPPGPAGSAYAALNRQLAGDGKSYELSVVNALWGEKTYAFLAPFLAKVKQDYGAGLTPLDFVKDPDGSRRTINAAIEKQTRDRIKDLLSPEHVKTDTRLVLTNAIYFLGKWESEFKGRDTSDCSFQTLTAGQTVTVPMMTQRRDFSFAEDDATQILQMPYVGGQLAMLVLLPKGKDAAALAALEKSLNEKTLAAWTAKLKEETVLVKLPKFRLEGAFELQTPLQTLGIKDAFVYGPADFSGMDGTRDLFISAVVHKTFVDVAEKGTEAAAATAVVMTMGAAMPPPQAKHFIADHPFIFAIRDLKSGALLFLGRLVKPEGGSSSGARPGKR